jgi:caffeoyl-CoA O-methyltransferase
VFHDIPEAVRIRMKYLEALDAADRIDGTPRSRRLRQIPRETGQLLAILAAGAPAGSRIEIGTSAGYSTLWLSLASSGREADIITFEPLPEKVRLALETFRSAGISKIVKLIEGNAQDYLGNFPNIAFCFLDADKEVYPTCYELVVPRLVPGGLLVADNVISHKGELGTSIEQALSDARLDSVIVREGNGLLVARRC